MHRKLLYWFLQVAGWGLQGAINLLFLWIFDPRSVLHAAVVYGSCSVSGIALSQGLRIYIRKKRWLELPLARSGWRYLLASLSFGILQTIWAAIAYRLLLEPRTFQQLGWITWALPIWTVTFIFWIAIYTSVVQSRRAQESERRRFETELLSKDAELKDLLRQVNPHFLFNSLNSIRGLVHENPSKAGQMIDELAGLLRYSLQSGEKRTVTLGEELEAVRRYLQIEKIRFEERLQVEIDAGSGTDEAVLPPMLLQTLVENAVKHGIERQEKGGTVRVWAALQNGSLRFNVSNPGSIRDESNSTRIGLQNAAQRLQLLFGGTARLSVAESGGVVFADVCVPQEGPVCGL